MSKGSSSRGQLLYRAMSQDEQKYPNPSQFSPERFLDADGNLNDDTVNIAFGFGRRFVMISLFQMPSNILVIM